MSVKLDSNITVRVLFKQQPFEDQKVTNTALQALEAPTLQAKPLDLITQRHGVLWRCIGVTINPIGGKIYHYKLKDEYRDSEAAIKKQEEIFPATEPSGVVEFCKELQEIGYSSTSDESGVYLNLPDSEAIIAGYEKLREKRPKCPPLRIFSSKGIADDITFSRSYIDNDIHLSEGIEIIHDSIYHAARVLKMMILFPEKYIDAKGKIAGSVEKYLEDLNHLQIDKTHLRQATTLLSVFVDFTWAATCIFDLTDSSKEKMEEALDIWDDEDFQRYWRKIYHTPIHHQKAIDLWQTAFA
jgi:hypothetical protein